MKVIVTIVIDPPLTEVVKEEHDFVVLEASSESRKSLEWFLNFIKEREVCHTPIEECK